MSKAEAIAKYHDEHAGYGGASREFHMRAATILRDQEQQITALRQRAEQAQSSAEMYADRAGKAERERDEARHDRDLMEKQWRGAVDVANRNAGEALNLDIAWEAMKGRAERAETDNAALLTAISKALQHGREDANPKECQCGGEQDTNVEEHDETCSLRFLEPRLGGPILGGAHPGATLLEYIRALETVAGAARVFGGNSRLLHDAIAAADALRVKP